MKHHLNILLLAIRAAIIILTGTAVYRFFCAYVSFTDKEAAIDYVHSTFTVPRGPLIIETYPIQVFFILYGLLLCYLVYVLVKLYRSFDNLYKGNIFYESQAAELRKEGSGIIIFAKLQYLLFCATGSVFYFDLATLIL
jgi:hypothetical protein